MGKINLQTSKKRAKNLEVGEDGAEFEPVLPDVGIETMDEMEIKLHSLSSHMTKHMPKYAAGAIALALAGAGLSWWMSSRSTRAAAKTDTLFEGVTVVQRPTKDTVESEAAILDLLGQQDPTQAKKKKGEPKFATDADKWKAAAEAAEKAKAELSGPQAALAAGVVARTQVETGKAAEAAKGFAELAGTTDAASLKGVALESQGNAAWNAGDAAGAAAAYEQLGALDDPYYKVRSAMLLGDVNNPGMGGKDAAKAKAQYDKALELLTPAEGQVFGSSLRALRGEVVRRRAQL